jgi:hypothetical protein
VCRAQLYTCQPCGIVGPCKDEGGEAEGAGREDEGLRQAAPEHAGVRRRLQGQLMLSKSL